jgi:5-methylcytosine-specific restriction endonuclease McrA
MTSLAERRQCLVLNADYRPISTWPPSIIPSFKAVSIFYRERADVVDVWPEVFRSPSFEIPVPKVIALKQYQPVCQQPKFCRRSIYLRDRYRCQYCGQKFQTEELTFDHVVPRSKGGRTTWENILTCCISCNSLKRSQDANYSGRKGVQGTLRPLKPPRRPSAQELLKAGLELIPEDLKEDYGSYLYWHAELEG